MVTIVLIVNEVYRPGAFASVSTPFCEEWTLYPIYGFCLLWILTVPYFLYGIRNVTDGLWMKQEVAICLFVFLPSFAIVVVSNSFEWGISSSVIGTCVIAIHTCTIIIPSLICLFGMVEKRIQARHRKKSINSNHIDYNEYQELLRDKKFFQSFQKYLASCFCIENALFYEDYHRFLKKTCTEKLQHHANEIRKILIKRECKKLYNKFLLPDAQYELNIPASVTERVLEEMKAGHYSRTLFENVYKEVLKMMYENNLVKFVQKFGRP